MQKSTSHKSKSTKSVTLDMQLKVLDDETEMGKFDEQDQTCLTTQKL